MATITMLSRERVLQIRARFGRDARAMFRQGGLNTAEIGQVLDVPEAEIVRKQLHRAPVPSFTIDPGDMPPPRGGHAA
jgi:hypothetical protein